MILLTLTSAPPRNLTPNYLHEQILHDDAWFHTTDLGSQEPKEPTMRQDLSQRRPIGVQMLLSRDAQLPISSMTMQKGRVLPADGSSIRRLCSLIRKSQINGTYGLSFSVEKNPSEFSVDQIRR